MGLTFKENCPDLRDCGAEVEVHDPWTDPQEAHREYGLTLVTAPAERAYDGVVLAVAHDQFRQDASGAIRKLGKDQHVLYDLKHVLPAGESDLRL